jgi:hypothetical protein
MNGSSARAAFRRLFFVMSLTALALLASRARADGPTDGHDDAAAQKQAAQALFDAAIQLMEAGSFAEACPKLAESDRLDPAGGTVLNLAFCHERAGAIALAYESYRVAKERAEKSGHAERAELASRRIAALAPKLGVVRVRFTNPDDASKATVTIDGQPSSAREPSPMLELGEHVVVVRGDGYEDFTFRVTLAKDSVDVVVPHLVPTAGAPAAEPRDPPSPAAGPEVGPASSLAPGATRSRRTAAWITGGVGIAFLGAGAIAGGLAFSRHAESDRECPGGACTDRGVQAEHEAKTFAVVADVTVAASIVVLGIATYLWLTEPTRSARARLDIVSF